MANIRIINNCFPLNLTIGKCSISLDQSDFKAKTSANSVKSFYSVNNVFPYHINDYQLYLQSIGITGFSYNKHTNLYKYPFYYLPKVLEEFGGRKMIFETKLFVLLPFLNNNEASMALDYLVKKWKSIIVSSPTNSSFKTYGTSLSHYRDFIQTVPYISAGVSLSQSLLKRLSLISLGPFQYDYKDLFDAFKSRLITQDRYPTSGVYFPIQLINKYVNVNAWIKSSIDNIVINVRDTNNKQLYFYLSELKTVSSSLLIIQKNGTVELFLNGNTYTVVNYDKKYLSDMSANALSDITIDHDPAIDNILKMNLNWKALNALKKIIDSVYGGNPSKIKPQPTKNAIANKVWSTISSSSFPNTKDVLEDLDRISGRIELSLLQRNLNSSKGASTQPKKIAETLERE